MELGFKITGTRKTEGKTDAYLASCTQRDCSHRSQACPRLCTVILCPSTCCSASVLAQWLLQDDASTFLEGLDVDIIPSERIFFCGLIVFGFNGENHHWMPDCNVQNYKLGHRACKRLLKVRGGRKCRFCLHRSCTEHPHCPHSDISWSFKLVNDTSTMNANVMKGDVKSRIPMTAIMSLKAVSPKQRLL